MPTSLSLQDWLTHLRILLPVTGMVHVGAGASIATAHYADWNLSNVILIEAEENVHERLSAITKGWPGWSVFKALVGDREGEGDYYVASNPNESGIIPAENLSSLWRNLKTRERRRLDVTTLAVLLSASSRPPESLNWAVIDCLPALPVMRGAASHLDGLDVIIARVVLDDRHLPDSGATKKEVDEFLSSFGFRCIACEEERQPAIGSALYVRDWQLALRLHVTAAKQEAVCLAKDSTESLSRLQSEKGELEKRAINLEQQVEELTKANRELSEVANDRKAQLEQLSETRDEQANLAARLQQQVEQIAAIRDEQSKLASERGSKLEKLIFAHDEKVLMTSELEALVDELKSAVNCQADLAARRHEQLEQMRLAREEQANLAAGIKEQLELVSGLCQERAERVTQLEAQLAEKELRQGYLNDELTKAEAQIELIKDVLLREAGV